MTAVSTQSSSLSAHNDIEFKAFPFCNLIPLIIYAFVVGGMCKNDFTAGHK